MTLLRDLIDTTEPARRKLLHTSDWHLAARGGTPRGAESGEAPG